MEIKNHDIEGFSKSCTNLNLFITCLPLILNFSWSTNILSVLAGVINKYAINESTLSALELSLNTNVTLAIMLLVIHFDSIFLFCVDNNKLILNK